MNAPIRSYCRFGLAWVVISVGFIGCSTTNQPEIKPAMGEPKFTGLVIEQGPGSLGAEPRREKITLLVLHHTAGSLASSLRTLQGRDPNHKVGVHFVVTDEVKPRVIRMVPDDMSAYHAGRGTWGSVTSLNQQSIGIEIINLDGNIHPYSEAQADILFALCADIIQRHDIKPWNVVAHSDIAIGRKIDPGTKFPWEKLASQGVGAWPWKMDVDNAVDRKVDLSPEYARRLLVSYGYGVEPGDAGLKECMTAFQRHFRPANINGVIDNESVIILEALLRRYHPAAYQALRVSP
jgi:N-acetyl-anhydromuramyl-L-alanine amidase AmpD